MESKKINQLATELAPELSDLTIIGDPTTGISKKITLSQMASLFTGTVEEYANLASFPLIGAADTIYIALDTNIIYRWNTSTNAYVELSPNIVTSLVFNDANGFDGTISLVGSTATLTITTALTQGSVGFIGASGALTQDNSNFYWDNSNKRLGINTNAPTTALDAFGSGIIGRLNGTSTNNAFLGFASAGTNKWSIGNVQSDHRFRIYNEATTSELVSVLQTGEVGIGIANPTTKLHIDGGASALIANLDANVSVAKSISFRSDNSNRINLEVSGTESGSNAGADLFIRTYTDAGALLATPLTITRSTGAIGIGITPSSWSGFSALQISSLGLWSTTANNSHFSSNLYYNGSDRRYITSDYATEYSQQTGVHKWYVAGSGTAGGTVSLTQAMTLLNNGNLGIGTTSPQRLLSISNNGAETVEIQPNFESNSPVYFNYNRSTATYLDPQYWAKTHRFMVNGGTEALRITSGGNVGIGNNNPQKKLDISGDAFAGIGIYDGTNTGVLQWHSSDGFRLVTSTAKPIVFFTNDAERMRIFSNGNVAIGRDTDAGYKLQIKAAGSTDTEALLVCSNGAFSVSHYFFSGVNSIMNTSDANIWLRRNGTTSRSINAAGTINASGADYAEYMLKATNENIEKGDIVGVDINGKLTNIFENSISFVVKSTDPSYVGGDTWFNVEPPMENDFDTKEEYQIAYEKFKEQREEARAKVDRIAFSGQVPCNILNAKVGDYIIPIKQSNGKISGQAVTNPTLEQYQISVGKVWKVMEDGRAWIAVKIG